MPILSRFFPENEPRLPIVAASSSALFRHPIFFEFRTNVSVVVYVIVDIKFVVSASYETGK